MIKIKKYMEKISVKSIAITIVILFIATSMAPLFVIASSGTIHVSPAAAIKRLAPGDSLPVSIKLINFGTESRIDVIIDYQIINPGGQVVVNQSETVAVETTATVVRQVPIPKSVGAGNYTFSATLFYPDQEYPAVSKFSFIVEKKIAGLFVGDFSMYALLGVGATLAIGTAFSWLYIGGRRRVAVINNAFDYSDKPKEQIPYYEIVSNVISQMRMHIGVEALNIAQSINGLEITPTGRVEFIGHDPAKIVSSLISKYEERTGYPLSFNVISPESRKDSNFQENSLNKEQINQTQNHDQ